MAYTFTNSASFPDVIQFFDETDGVLFSDPVNGSFEIYPTNSGNDGVFVYSSTFGINYTLGNELTIYTSSTSGKVIMSTASSQSAITNISVFNIIGKDVFCPQFIAGSSEIVVDLS